MIAPDTRKLLILLTAAMIGSSATAFGADGSGDSGGQGTSTLSLEVGRGDPIKAKDKRDLSKPVAALLQEHRFGDLDAMADEIRKENFHYADGKMKLEQFYSGLELSRKEQTDEDYKTHLDDLRLWIKEKPLSISARAALVSNLTDWAWKARGGGYANTVSSAQFQDFAKRLKEANQTFIDATKLATQCPHLYVGAQTVALGQNWSKPKYDDLVAQANKKFPTYYQFYFGKSYYLQPRWFGEQNEWVQYAAKAADAIGGADGAKLYARIVWNVDNYGFYPDIFGEFSELKWDKVKSGFEALSKEYPGNRTVTSEFCKLAWCAKDQKTATGLMTNLGNHCDISVWKKRARFLQAQQELIPQRKNEDLSKHPEGA